MVWRTEAIIPPTFVPACPVASTSGATRARASITSSAPRLTSTDRVRSAPTSRSSPAATTRSLTSPAGVRTTTADRLPVRARATGATVLVWSASRPKTPARP